MPPSPAVDDSPRQPSQSHSPTASQSLNPKPRKQVGWAAANGDGSSSNNPLPPRPRLTRHLSDTAVADGAAIPEIAEPTHEELKREITRIFTHDPETPDAPTLASTSASPILARPKGVLRSGNATPLIHSPPPELADDPGQAGKERSAQAAHQRATTLIDDLNSTGADDDDRSRSRSTRPDKHPRKSSRSRSRKRDSWFGFYQDADDASLTSGQSTPDYDPAADYVPPPSKYKAGPLSAKINFMNNWHNYVPRSGTNSRASSPPASPRHSINPSTSSIANLIQTSGNAFATPARPGLPRSDSNPELLRPAGLKSHRPGSSAAGSAGGFPFPKLPFIKGYSRTPSFDESQIKIHKHIQDITRRQRYLVKLCRALMAYGAPTHRLEEYMKMSARVLEIQAQFLYMPGCMIVSFDDPGMHTTEVKLVRVNQGVDLSKLWDTHGIYKDVVHDNMGVEEATARLDELLRSPDKFRVWFLVLVHGLASATVAPFAFSAKYPDLAPAFLLGCILGFLRLVVAPRSVLYTDIFEIFAVAITSFLSRWFGSMPGQYFCFSALAQSSIALILPGFHVMCAALELQSKSMVAGAVRMVYAIIFSLFIGFGVTIGTAIYGFIDSKAVTDATCSYTKHAPVGEFQGFIFVIIYSICLMVVNQAKWRNMPVMGVIAFAGYLVNYFCSQRFAGNSQISSTIASMTLSVLANLYGRLGQRTERIYMKARNWVVPRVLPHIPYLRDRLKWDAAAKGKEIDDPNFAEKQDEPEGQPSLLKRLYHSITNPKRRATDEEYDARVTSPPEVRVDDTDPESASSTRNNSVTTLVPESERRKSKARGASNYSLAAAAMLPGIFVLVPSGIAVGGSLVSGIQTAEEIVKNETAPTSTSSILTGGSGTNSVAFTVSYVVVQVAVGITVGLFIGSIVVYPFGKGGWKSKRMRSGLFSF